MDVRAAQVARDVLPARHGHQLIQEGLLPRRGRRVAPYLHVNPRPAAVSPEVLDTLLQGRAPRSHARHPRLGGRRLSQRAPDLLSRLRQPVPALGGQKKDADPAPLQVPGHPRFFQVRGQDDLGLQALHDLPVRPAEISGHGNALGLGRVVACAGPPHEPVAQAHRKHQLREARRQADRAHRRGRLRPTRHDRKKQGEDKQQTGNLEPGTRNLRLEDPPHISRPPATSS